MFMRLFGLQSGAASRDSSMSRGPDSADDQEHDGGEDIVMSAASW